MIIVIIDCRSTKSVFAEHAEKRHDVERRQLLALIEAFEQAEHSYEGEKEPPEEEPEDNETLGECHCPCSRQLPEGHRIPWYTSGFK